MSASQEQRDKIMANAARHLTFRRAALVAISSIEQSLSTTTNVRQAVVLNIQLIQLQAACMEAEREFSDALLEMSVAQKLYVLMQLIDRDGDGRIGLKDLTMALRKMDATKAYATSVEDANASLKKYCRDQDGCLDSADFELWARDMAKSLDCTFDDLSFLIVQYLAFNDTGHDVIREALESHDSEEDGKDLSKYEDEVTETRIALLFQSLDYNGIGHVLFLHVFERLFDVICIMDPTTRKSLFMMDRTKELDYYEFHTLLLNVTATSPVHFHDIADSITLATGRGIQAKEVEKMFATLQYDKAFQSRVPKELKNSGVTPVTYGRIQNLFRIMRGEGMSHIEGHEMIVSLRKLHGTTPQVDATIEETMSKVAQLDERRVGEKEFASIICRLASELQIDVNELISFLAISWSLRRNEEAQTVYVEKMKWRVVRKVKVKNESGGRKKRSSWMLFNNLTNNSSS
jgi:hypothetical protein